jgi:glutathione S-transferase
VKLFYAGGSCALASHIALHEAGAEFEAVKVDLKAGEQKAPEYLAVNPKGRVPALVTRRGTLTENPAILHWIAVAFPNARLAPLGDPWAMAQVLSFNVFLGSSVHPAFAHLFRPGRYAHGEAAAEAMKAKVPEQLGEYFGVVEQQLERGPWVHGEAYTTSDCYLYVFARWLQKPELGPERFPRVRAHLERMQERPAVSRALEAEGLTAL